MNFPRSTFVVLCVAAAGVVSAQTPIDSLPRLSAESYDGALELQLADYLRGLDAAGRLEAEQALLAVATNPESSLEGRRMACRSLISVSTDASAIALGPLLGNPEIAHDARSVIEMIPGETADKVLVEGLSTTEGSNWLGIVDSLAIRRTASAVEPLAAIAVGDDAEKAAVAIRALGAIGNFRGFAALSQIEAAGELKNLRAEALLKAGQILIRDEGYVSAVASELDDLIAENDSFAIRVAAWRLLIQARPGDAVGVVADLLSSEDSANRMIGASALDLLVSDDSIAELLAKWSGFPSDSQARVLTYLSTTGRSQVVGVARKSLDAADLETRINAIKAVGIFGTPADLPVLFALIREGGAIEEAAIDALATLPDRKVDALLVEEFERENSPVRSQLAEVFAARADTSAIPVLLIVAKNADARLAASAYRAVGSLGGIELVPELLKRRDMADSSNRRSIERALIEIGRRHDDGQVVDLLTASWPVGDEANDSSVIRMVGAIGDSAGLAFLAPLVEASPPNPVALTTVCRWTDAEVLPLLKSVVERKDLPETDRRSAWQGILRLTPEFGWPQRTVQVEWAGVLLDTASSTDDRLRALEAFGAFFNPQMIPFLETWVGDAEVGAAAKAAQDSVRILTEN